MRVILRGIGLFVLGMGLVTALAGFYMPTARAAEDSITLTSFSAKAKPGAKVLVKWATGTEVNVFGFEVLRATKQNGPFKNLNKETIPSNNPRGISGDNYSYQDKSVKAGKTYFYQLEVVKAPPPNEKSNLKKVTAKP